jgi:hypothetical protein
MLLKIRNEIEIVKSVEYKFEYFNSKLKTEHDRLYIIEGCIKDGSRTFNLDLLKRITTLLSLFIQKCDNLNDEHVRYLKKFQKLTDKIEPSNYLIKLMYLLTKSNENASELPKALKSRISTKRLRLTNGNS